MRLHKALERAVELLEVKTPGHPELPEMRLALTKGAKREISWEMMRDTPDAENLKRLIDTYGQMNCEADLTDVGRRRLKEVLEHGFWVETPLTAGEVGI